MTTFTITVDAPIGEGKTSLLLLILDNLADLGLIADPQSYKAIMDSPHGHLNTVRSIPDTIGTEQISIKLDSPALREAAQCLNEIADVAPLVHADEIVDPQFRALSDFLYQTIGAGNAALADAPIGSWIEDGAIVVPTPEDPGNYLVEQAVMQLFGYAGIDVYNASEDEWDEAERFAGRKLFEEQRARDAETMQALDGCSFFHGIEPAEEADSDVNLAVFASRQDASAVEREGWANVIRAGVEAALSKPMPAGVDGVVISILKQ